MADISVNMELVGVTVKGVILAKNQHCPFNSASASASAYPILNNLPPPHPNFAGKGKASLELVTENTYSIPQSFVVTMPSLPRQSSSNDDHPDINIPRSKNSSEPRIAPLVSGSFQENAPTSTHYSSLSSSYGNFAKQASDSELSLLPLSRAATFARTRAIAKSQLPLPYAPGEAPIERLPTEIQVKITLLLISKVSPSTYTPRNIDLLSCLLASRTLYAIASTVLYKNITIPHSIMFSRFRRQISKNTNFAEIVQRLDFSQFTSVGLGRTRRMNLEIQNLTAATFLDCLTKVPNLQELLVQEHLEDDLDDKVISKIFLGLPLLKAIDFCAASSPKFQNAFNSVITVDNLALPLQFNIRRFSLHECNTLPASAFEIILPRMAHLTHLDVFHTRISDKALLSIPCSAQLSHLNIGRCNGLSGKIIVNFLTSSTIACELIFLGIYSDVSSNQLLSSEDIDCLLPNLPNSLKSLNLNGAEINSTHISALVSLTKHLEELSLGHADLSIDDIKALFAPSEYRFSTEKTFYESPEEELWIQPALHYLDLTGVPCVTPGSFISTLSVLLLPKTKPLEVLEVGALAIQGLKQRSACTKRLGWVVTECGRRGWLVREPSTDAYTHSNSGRRSWKMGAVWWGMRKVPVADAEVGGLYGHYMFKK